MASSLPSNNITITPADAPIDLENLPPSITIATASGINESLPKRPRRSSDTNDHKLNIAPPTPPPMSASPPRVLVIGAGSRGRTYARCTVNSSNGVVVAVAEPDDYKRRIFGETFIWGSNVASGDGTGQPAKEGAEFKDWKDFITYEKRRRERAQKAEWRRKDSNAMDTDMGITITWPDGNGEGNIGSTSSRNNTSSGAHGIKEDSNDIPEGIDAVFICVRDELHHEVVTALAPLGLHIMCEKPLATNLRDCIDMYRALEPNTNSVFSVGHVLRYSPHNMLLRSLLFGDGKNGAPPANDEDGLGAIGEILSVHHTEPVGWWHFAHSYVRGNWRREDTTAPSLLTKSCHDIDLLLWLLCSPPPGSEEDAQPHLPSTVSSSGQLQFFKKSRKPKGAGDKTTNCLSCPVEKDCMYSAKRIYVSDKHQGLETGNTGWPMSIVMPDIESFDNTQPADGCGDSPRKAELLRRLAEDYSASTPEAEVKARNWFGRCVFESDNDVCDEQTVTLTWDEEREGFDFVPTAAAMSADPSLSASSPHAVQHRGAKQATFHMIAQTKRQCQRFTHIYGTHGEIYADSWTITVEHFPSGTTKTYTPKLESLGHGGGDVGLTRQFIMAVDKVKNHNWTAEKAQREYIGCSLEEVIRSHAMVFAAEEARTGRKVVDWKDWWEEKVGSAVEEWVKDEDAVIVTSDDVEPKPGFLQPGDRGVSHRASMVESAKYF